MSWGIVVLYVCSVTNEETTMVDGGFIPDTDTVDHSLRTVIVQQVSASSEGLLTSRDQ